jgi:hypothetical protein
VTAGGSGHRVSFEQVGRYVREIDPQIHPYVFGVGRRHVLWQIKLAFRPTLILSTRPTRLRPWRGVLYQGEHLTKGEEYAVLGRAGLAVPRWAFVTPAQVPDLSAFGRYVVVKPDWGQRGAEVRIVRRNRVQWRRVSTSLGPSGRLLAQEFVYTGRWPISYRVTTLFGQTLWSLRSEASHERPPLSGPDAFDRVPGGYGLCIVASSRGCTMSLNYDEEVIQLGERVHSAFPRVPLLGVDIVREQPSGRLYILEVHASWGSWHFASATDRRLQRQSGFSLAAQFDGLHKAARILAERTRREAA